MNSQPNPQEHCVSQGYNKLFVILIVFGVLLSPAYADIIIPTITNVYFEKEGKAHNKPVSFTVNCYGYTWLPGTPVEMTPGTYIPEKVFSFSADCPQYGCEIYENYYLNYRHTDYCDLEGETEGERFVIRKYASSPVDSCELIYDNPNFERKCELRFDIPTSSDLADSDNDGVIDQWDQCPETPEGIAVYNNGCPAIKGDFNSNNKLDMEDCIGILQRLTNINIEK